MVSIVRSVLNSRYFIWAVLCLPSFAVLSALLEGGDHAAADALHESGEFSARLMILAMMMTPLVMLAPRWRFFRWLMARRRYFGVAAFSYAVAHAVIYLVDLGSVREVWGQFFTLSILAGWVGLFFFLPLAVTSNDWAARLLGRRWKLLHRLVYAAAVVVLAHWGRRHAVHAPRPPGGLPTLACLRPAPCRDGRGLTKKWRPCVCEGGRNMRSR